MMNTLLDHPIFWKGVGVELEKLAQKQEEEGPPKETAGAAPEAPKDEKKPKAEKKPEGEVPPEGIPEEAPIEEAPPAPQMPVVEMDVSLITRLFDWAHLEVQNPTDLHIMASRLLQLYASYGAPLTAEDFDTLVGDTGEMPEEVPPEAAGMPPVAPPQQGAPPPQPGSQPVPQAPVGEGAEGQMAGNMERQAEEEEIDPNDPIVGFSQRLFKAAQERAQA
jgi:hypothetical protein